MEILISSKPILKTHLAEIELNDDGRTLKMHIPDEQTFITEALSLTDERN